MNEEFLKSVRDYFTSAELVELLSVPIDQLVPLLEDYIEDNIDDLKEEMNYGDDN